MTRFSINSEYQRLAVNSQWYASSALVAAISDGLRHGASVSEIMR